MEMDFGVWGWNPAGALGAGLWLLLFRRFAVPALGVLAGVILAHVKKDRGWYLLSLVFGVRLIRALGGLLFLTLLGASLRLAFPAPF